MDQEPIHGYVRCVAIHREVIWRFEALDAGSQVALVTIETADGDVQVALIPERARELLRELELFLAHWPEGHTSS
jgi:hypothetical protein